METAVRKIIIGALVSLDGVKAPGGPQEDPTRGFQLGGWVMPHADEVFGQAINEMFGQPFDLLLGRKPTRSLQRIGPTLKGVATILSRGASTVPGSTSRCDRTWS
jgi:hypothetical protein